MNEARYHCANRPVWCGGNSSPCTPARPKPDRVTTLPRSGVNGIATHSVLSDVTPSANASVRHDVLLCCLAPSGRRTTLAATLSYTALDPFAVALVFHGPSDDVVWLVDRQLLMAGRDAAAGEGDVLVRPARGEGTIVIQLRSPDGTLEAVLPRDDLDAFVARTLALVPLGEERLDPELLLDALLGSEAE